MMPFQAMRLRQEAGGPPPIATKWDSAAKGAAVVLSSSDMQAGKSGSGWQSVYGTVGKSSGKWQFEMQYLSGTGTNRPFAAIADKTNAANLYNSFAGNNVATVSESVGAWGNGTTYWNLSTGASNSGHSGSPLMAIVTVTLDLTLGVPQFKYYINGVLNSTVNLPTGKTWYPVTSLQGGGTARLIPSGLTYPQAGFTDWG